MLPPDVPPNVRSIAAHGDPAQTSLALRYPEQCDGCLAPIPDWRPRQRLCADCRKRNRRALERRKYRQNDDYRARRVDKARRYYDDKRATA